MTEIIRSFPRLKYVNSPKFDYQKVNYADFYVLRSADNDDIHKSIKYGVWTSTIQNNVTLTESFREGKQVFLIFSVRGSGQFMGVAKMKSEFRKNDSFKYWWECCKWFGMFEVDWVFIKDIKQKSFDHLDFTINDLEDGTYLNIEEGKEILRIFQEYEGKGNIFSAFELMDEREDNLRYTREKDELKLQFDELSKKYGRDPITVHPKKKYRRKPRVNHYPKHPGFYGPQPYYPMPYNYPPGYPYYKVPPNQNFGGWAPGYFQPGGGAEYPPVGPKMKWNPQAEPYEAKDTEKKEEEKTKN